MRKKKIIGALALSTLAAFALGGAALAKGGPGGHGGHPGKGGFFGPGMHRIVAELDLSEDQKALAMELREEARSGQEDERAERDQSFQVLLTELGKAEPDASVLHGLVDQKLDSLASRMHDGVDAFLTLHATFTPEQRETLVTEMESRREEAKARHEQGRGEMDEEGRGRGRR